MITLRQIEVIRAIMVAGTVAGAARLLNVSAPGISRTMKYTEDSLGVRLFLREGGRFVPTPEARDIFSQIDAVYKKVEDLHFAIDKLEQGDGAELRIASVPSIANVMVPRALKGLRQRYPQLQVDMEIVRIEEAIDYLLLGKGEAVAVSSKLDHPALTFKPLAQGELVCVVPQDHALAGLASIDAATIAAHPLIGIDPRDPHGRIMAGIFARCGLDYDITIRARFGTTVLAMVRENLGIAIIDTFTIADESQRHGLRIIPISEPTEFPTYLACRADISLTSFADQFSDTLRQEMAAICPQDPQADHDEP